MLMTRLKLRSPKYLIPYLIQSEQIITQIVVSQGFLKGKILATLGLSMWTATLWSDRDASYAFHLRGKHQNSMPLFRDWAEEAVLGVQTISSEQLPSWSHIAKKLEEIGHFYRLDRCSENHLNQIIPTPKIPIYIQLFSKI